MSESDRLIWCDLETFGLDPDTDPILELGFKITDLDLNTLDEQDWVVWDKPTYQNQYERLRAEVNGGNENSKFILDMHTKSELWVDCMQNGLPLTQVEDEALDFLDKHHVTKEDPLCGSSVQFDRSMLFAQMTPVHDLFSYRNIDISSVKELCRRYNPAVYKKLDQEVKNMKHHRVMDDLDDTVNEFRFYRDNFLWVASDAE